MGLRSLLDQDIGIDDIVQEQPATNEFNVIHALGRVYRRAAKGEFGLPIAGAQTWMNHYTTTDASASVSGLGGAEGQTPETSFYAPSGV